MIIFLWYIRWLPQTLLVWCIEEKIVCGVLEDLSERTGVDSRLGEAYVLQSPTCDERNLGALHPAPWSKCFLKDALHQTHPSLCHCPPYCFFNDSTPDVTRSFFIVVNEFKAGKKCHTIVYSLWYGFQVGNNCAARNRQKNMVLAKVVHG